MNAVPGAGELQGLIAHLEGVQTTVRGLGGPIDIAGDPAGLQQLAGSHRDLAATLRSTLQGPQAGVTGLTGGGLWLGPASEGFTGFWGQFHASVASVAAAHDQMAASLEAAAARASGLDRDVQDVFGRIESWLRSAVAVVSTLDAGAIGRLLGEGQSLIAHWGRLFAELETFASGLASTLEADLGFSGPAAMSSPAGQRPGPLINVPPLPLPPWIDLPLPPLRPPIGIPLPPVDPKPLVNVPPPPLRPPIGIPLPSPPVSGPGPGLAFPLLTASIGTVLAIGGLLSAAKGGQGKGSGGQVPGRGKGPSGKPKIHIVRHPSRKRAKDAARRDGKGAPVKHPNPRVGDPHFHPGDQNGNKIQDGVHHVFPRRFA